jgi:flagellar basal-body rod protein FlgF
MNIGIYQGASSLAALERWQEMISQNIGASQVPGFKKSEMTFDAVLGATARTGSEGGFGKDVNSAMPRHNLQLNFEPGELRTTGNELDFAIQGAGFFQIQKPDGQTGFTRDGQFRLSPDRTLVTSKGHTVMGDGGPITLRPGGGKVSVTEDGMIIQGDAQVGRIAVFDFAEPSKLQRIGDGLLGSPDASVQPRPVERPGIVGGSLEGSNVSPLREMVSLITVGRAYEANQRMIHAADETSSKAIQTLGNPNA